MNDEPGAHSADPSNGYETVSSEFIAIRTRSMMGVATVRAWAEALSRGATILDLGCGHGVPISAMLADAGFAICGIDAAPSLVAAFRARFPTAPIECARVEDSQFFNRRFDGVVAWGLVFLLAPEAQAELIHKVARTLTPGGRFLFTAPARVTDWDDILTGHRSHSLGSDEYRRILCEAGLVVTGEAQDEGENHYYFACRPTTGRPAQGRR